MIGVLRNFNNIRKLCPSVCVIIKQNLHSVYPNIIMSTQYLNEFIFQNVHKWHDKTALVCAETDRSYTYSELHHKTITLANFLHTFNNLNKSDTVAVVLPNIPEYAIILLGAIEAGLRVTTINPFFTADEISRQLVISETKLLFTTTEIYNVSLEALQLAKLEVPIITVKTKKESALPNGSINFNDVVKERHRSNTDLQRNAEDTIIIPFSSGTSGFPKGVELTNKNIISSLLQITNKESSFIDEANGSEQEVVPIILPMYHIYGMVAVLMQGLVKGCKLITIPKFKTQAFINLLEKHKPTILFVVPPIFQILVNNNKIKKDHLKSLKTILSGAAPLGASDIQALNDKTNNGVSIVQAYGSTESSAISHMQNVRFKNGVKAGGIGMLVPSTEAKIVSTDTCKELCVNQTGELLLRGPQIMKGYYKNEKASKEAFTDDRWFKTGDVGHYDEDGHFFITDRIKDLIKVKGYQVAPAELEELLRRHPDIEDVAVVGVAHKTYGEGPKAFVVRKPGSTISSTTIQEFVKSKVVNYKHLTGGVSFIDSIPKSPSGKILRRQLQ